MNKLTYVACVAWVLTRPLFSYAAELDSKIFIPTKLVYPGERVYIVNLPPPFGLVDVTLSQNESKLSQISVSWADETASLSDDLLLDSFTELREAEFTYTVPDENVEIESFKISFSYGSGENIRMSDGRLRRIHNAVQFIVSNDGSVRYEVVDLIGDAKLPIPVRGGL